MRRSVIVLFVTAAAAFAAEDPLALNDPLRQLMVDTTTKGDGDFLTRTAVAPLPVDGDEESAGLALRPPDALASATRSDPLERFRRGSDTNAIPQLTAYLQQHPGRADGWQLLGEILFRQRDFAGAEKALSKARDLMPLNSKALNDYAASLIMQSKLPEAAALLEAELARRPDNHAARFNLACVAVRQGRPAGALDHLARLERERWPDLALHLTDSDLDPLRRLPEFIKLETRVKAARGRPAGPIQGI